MLISDQSVISKPSVEVVLNNSLFLTFSVPFSTETNEYWYLFSGLYSIFKY